MLYLYIDMFDTAVHVLKQNICINTYEIHTSYTVCKTKNGNKLKAGIRSIPKTPFRQPQWFVVCVLHIQLIFLLVRVRTRSAYSCSHILQMYRCWSGNLARAGNHEVERVRVSSLLWRFLFSEDIYVACV